MTDGIYSHSGRYRRENSGHDGFFNEKKKKKKKKNVIHLMAEIDDVVFQTGVRAEIFVVSAVGTAARRVVDVLAVQLAGQSVGTGRHDASFARTGEKFKHPSEATSTSTMATIARERKLCVRVQNFLLEISAIANPHAFLFFSGKNHKG